MFALTGRRLAAALVVFTMTAAACGGGDDDGDSSDSSEQAGGADDTTAPSATSPETDDTVADGSGVVVGGEATIALTTNPSSLDPHLAVSGFDLQSLYMIYDRLLTYDPQTLEIEPGLAESWEFTSPTTLVLKIRDGITFHDGTPLDAEAVKFSLERPAQLEGSPVAAEAAVIDSVEVTGDHEVTLELAEPTAALLASLADRLGMIVSPTAVGELGDDFELHPVGAGMFVVDEFVPEDAIQLSRFDSYWEAGKPYLDAVTLRILRDANAASNALIAGQVDVLSLPPLSQVGQLQGQSGIEVSIAPSTVYHKILFNHSADNMFSNQDMREAINLAIDRDAFSEAIVFGLGTPAYQPFPAGHWAHAPELENAWPLDRETALSHVQEAGFEGATVKAIVLSSLDSPRAAEFIQQELKQIGLDMQIEIMESAAGIEAMFVNGDADLFISGHTGRMDPALTIGPAQLEGGSFRIGPAAPGMAEAAELAQQSVDRDERAAAYEEVVRIMQETSDEVPIVHVPMVAAFHEYIQGYEPNVSGRSDFTSLWRQP